MRCPLSLREGQGEGERDVHRGDPEMSPECRSEHTPALSRVRSATVDEVPVAAAAQGEGLGAAQRVVAPGLAAAGPSDTAARRNVGSTPNASHKRVKSASERSATVGEVPVAAAAQGKARWSGSARRCTRPCCGWSFGHSHAQVFQLYGWRSLIAWRSSATTSVRGFTPRSPWPWTRTATAPASCSFWPTMSMV